MDLAAASRRWEAYIRQPSSQNSEPFHISAKVTFEWDPINAARGYTCEEDLLTELIGRKQRYPKTQQRWTRVDLTLHATLPYGSTTPMPDLQIFGPWASSIGEKLDRLLAESKERQGRIVAITGGREEIAAEARGCSGGTLFLKGVVVSAFRLVRIPRVWDDLVGVRRRTSVENCRNSLRALETRSTNGIGVSPISGGGFAIRRLHRGQGRPGLGSRARTKIQK